MGIMPNGAEPRRDSGEIVARYSIIHSFNSLEVYVVPFTGIGTPFVHGEDATITMLYSF